MKNRHHVVRVTTRGYHLLRSYPTQIEALRHIKREGSTRTGADIYRNGETGRRLSMQECYSMLEFLE